MPAPSSPFRFRRWIPILSCLAVLALGYGLRASASDRDRVPHAAHTMSGHAMSAPAMDEAAMAREVEAWYAEHPAHGGTDAAASDTFLVRNFQFDTDGNVGTQVDTAKILVGESILWKWVEGTHTTTSGDPNDKDAGSLWSHAITSATANREFTFTFSTAGTYKFHCLPHGAFFNMVGFVRVSENPVDVPGLPGIPDRSGFVTEPSPNPTRGRISFRFGLREAGAVKIAIFDASGRRIAMPVEREMPAGTFDATWDGRSQKGVLARAGVYYVQLLAPGVRDTRRVVLEH